MTSENLTGLVSGILLVAVCLAIAWIYRWWRERSGTSTNQQVIGTTSATASIAAKKTNWWPLVAIATIICLAVAVWLISSKNAEISAKEENVAPSPPTVVVRKILPPMTRAEYNNEFFGLVDNASGCIERDVAGIFRRQWPNGAPYQKPLVLRYPTEWENSSNEFLQRERGKLLSTATITSSPIMPETPARLVTVRTQMPGYHPLTISYLVSVRVYRLEERAEGIVRVPADGVEWEYLWQGTKLVPTPEEDALPMYSDLPLTEEAGWTKLSQWEWLLYTNNGEGFDNPQLAVRHKNGVKEGFPQPLVFTVELTPAPINGMEDKRDRPDTAPINWVKK